VRRYVFLIGTGRTGTVYLSRYLAARVRGAVTAHEPSKRIKLRSNRFLAGRESAERMRAFLTRYRSALERRLDRTSCQAYFQVDPWLYGFTRFLEEVFEEPRVVHLVRHPFTYVTSHLNRIYREPWVAWLKRRIPYWFLRGDRTGDYTSKEWNALSPQERMAWYWVTCNRFIDANAEGLSHFRRMKYEDLFATEGEGLKALLDFCEVEEEVEVETLAIERNRAPERFEPVSEWPSEVVERVGAMCRPLMERYGYADRRPLT